ncbi:hypothetical protein ACMHYB_48835 [Sorangium sp. So ce1128]
MLGQEIAAFVREQNRAERAVVAVSSDGYSNARLCSRHEALTRLEEPRQILAFTLKLGLVWPE